MAKKLWQPSGERIHNSHMYRFMTGVNEKHGLECTAYDDLYQWSIHHIPDFLGGHVGFRRYSGVPALRPGGGRSHPNAGGRAGSRGRASILRKTFSGFGTTVWRSSSGAEDRPPVTITYAELYDEVARVARSLREASGFSPETGWRVFMPNMPETIVAMLAAVSLGATWSSCSPDFGIKGVLDRFGQIRPPCPLHGERVPVQGQGVRFPRPGGGHPQGPPLH